MPLHGVINESSETTKLRVVFDASTKTTSRVSLNGCLKAGPIILEDLISILIRFRTDNIVLTADVAKMYRQITICQEQRDLQLILWRNNDNDEIEHYRLNTVTYETASASFFSNEMHSSSSKRS